MRTQLIGKIDLDQTRLAADLEASFGINFAEPYDEFVCGRPWKSAMLMAPGGGEGGLLSQFDPTVPSAFTADGKRLPYVQELIGKLFATEHITFVRMVALSNSVLVPHCDYVELSDDVSKARIAHRVHIVLSTGEDAMFNESDSVYRMKEGEVWFIDVTKPHSAGVVGETRRVHLLIDVANVDDVKDLFKFEHELSGVIPEANVCDRPTLSDGERDGLLGLSKIIDEENIMEVLGLVIRKHYRRDGGPDFVWRTMRDIARLSNDERIVKKVADLYRHTNLQRIES
ncbi:aspartyl/asparaginyl beta-hydroxylase domain-containing protein [Micromonospora sp. STR1_7]|uniref:Aspartyl/asparaginyl beta-hydroxylase domain-containing protein n=1 Tax=Micromonospora parastrephiae TaxID=2806101 RepID=A0ABS1XNC4_9ACTN|nr:aspartyl/asparaginyl beta-hydroxylase domain-containing protein [Micromonospora parastrephiae]MBM0230761.1 aspartyl/asparaginyl beta-hydroxylase domain-containing protein [Micromonospora parastrephiae]